MTQSHAELSSTESPSDAAGWTFEAYRLKSPKADSFTLQRADRSRSWMDDSPGRFAYRCLPLVMANQMGWTIHCPVSFNAVWSGAADLEATKFDFEDDDPVWCKYVLSNFGSGIVTFSMPFLFRTPPGIGLIVRGPTNHFVVGAAALDGFVETSWLDLSFTMNWKLLEPNRISRFRKGEPICLIQPIQVAVFEGAMPELKILEENPMLQSSFRRMSASRREFIADKNRGTAWQKHYFKGENLDGIRASDHRSKLRLREFVECQIVQENI